VVVDDLEHFLGLEMLEVRPAEVFLGTAFGIFALGEYAAFQLLQFEARDLVFFQRVQVVETLEEQQAGDLLDDFERVGDAAGPEGVPEGVNFTVNFAGKHIWLRTGKDVCPAQVLT